MIYAGETVRVYADIQGWDDTPLGPNEVNSATVVITDREGLVVEAAAEMQWVSEEGRWRYDWNSPAVAGGYTIEVIFSTPEGTSVDVRKVRLDSPRPVREVRNPLFVRE